jgi:putative photosynthetic complex assembly protein 2
MSFGLPALSAVLAWWGTTGLILFLIGLPRRTYPWTVFIASALLAAALQAVHISATETSASGAYLAFAGALTAWGWLEITFLTGYLTGPRKTVSRGHSRGWARFWRASQVVIHNELATAALTAALAALTWNASNRVGLATFLCLWGLRLSAKLNLFLGVPNLGEQFLPPHLQYFKSYFRRRRMNALLPFSIAASTALVALLARRFLASADAFHATGYALLTTLVALGLLEHAFMIVPIPSERLWRWGTPKTTLSG